MSPKLGLQYASCCQVANDTKCVIGRPWRLDDWLGIAGKDCLNCLWSLESWVACRQCPYRRLSALFVISTSQALLSCSRIDWLIQSHRCGAGLVSLYCIWRWPRLFILVTLAEVSMAGDGTDLHTQEQASRWSVVSLSNLPLP